MPKMMVGNEPCAAYGWYRLSPQIRKRLHIGEWRFVRGPDPNNIMSAVWTGSAFARWSIKDSVPIWKSLPPGLTDNLKVLMPHSSLNPRVPQ